MFEPIENLPLRCHVGWPSSHVFFIFVLQFWLFLVHLVHFNSLQATKNTGSSIFSISSCVLCSVRFQHNNSDILYYPKAIYSKVLVTFFSASHFGTSFFWLDHMCGWKRAKDFYELTDCVFFFLFKVNFPYALSFPFAILPNMFQTFCICNKERRFLLCAECNPIENVNSIVAVVRKPIRWSEWTHALRIPPGIIDGFSHSGASLLVIFRLFLPNENRSIPAAPNARRNWWKSELTLIFSTEITKNFFFSRSLKNQPTEVRCAHKMKIMCFCAFARIRRAKRSRWLSYYLWIAR